MIELIGLSKKFHRGKPNEITALRNVTIHIGKSEFVVLIGSNGSGKSTLLNLVAGDILPSGGRILINAQDVTALPEYKRSRWIARVFQNPLQGTAPDLSIIENFRLAYLRTSTKKVKIGLNAEFRNMVSERIETVGLGLESKLDQPMGSLSGGQRQALSLLMAVMTDIDILLLDEPTAALDPRSSEIVLQTADKLIENYGITAVMVTHNLKDAHQFGSRLVQLHNGEVVRDIKSQEKKRLTYTDMYEWFL